MILPIGTVAMQLQANPQLPPVFPSPSATPVSERSLLSAGLNAIVARAQAKTGGTLGVVIVDLGTGVTVERNGDAAFPLASVHKLALAVCAYAAIDAGTLTTDETVELAPSDIVRTVSPIAPEYARGRRSYAVRELIARMLLESDNTAADALYRLLGGAAGLNDRLRALGIDGIVYRTNEAGLIEDAANGRTFARGGDNAGTPASVASLLGALETGHILSPASRTALLATLGRVQTSPGRLRSGFPPETDLAHKTGTSETIGGTTDATNDAGIARVNRRSIVIVAMLAHARGTSAERDAILASVARLAYDATRLFPMR
ncbi:MAG: class A beta-lactamase-related serine hydrolase [Candidatus Eremiobacteraeota bacterium]|nr:class A beta-lactamase-related serine hydrolase [Candidatus Eremiobacteraeota bacterium]